MNRIIFTDIDGVYNTPAERQWDKFTIIKPCINAIKDVCEEFNAKVVISSSWRVDYPEEAKELGFDLHDDWCTPFLDGGKNRGKEVDDWINRNGPVEYVIIDDWADFLPDQMWHLVQTDRDKALTQYDVDLVRDILYKPERFTNG